MHLRFLSLALAALVVLQLALAHQAAAGAPTDQIRGHVEAVYKNTNRAGAGGTDERSVEARKIMAQMFDWAEMSRRALGPHWAERSPAERTEFVRLFTALFERAYLSKVHLVDAERFQYLGDTIQGDEAVVRTKVLTKHDQEIPVNYRTRRDEGGRWRVYDLDVEGISLVDNYRRQFNSIITRSSYSDLVSKLSKAVEDKRGS